MGSSPATSTAWGRAELDPRALSPLGLTVHTRSGSNPRGVAGGHAGPRHRRPPLLRRYPGTGPEWVGRRLDAGTLSDLQQLADRDGFDACGEQGSTTPW